MSKKRNWCARAGTATYIIVHRSDTRRSSVIKVMAHSAEPFSEQCGEYMVMTAWENGEWPESRQGGRKTDLHGFYCRFVSRIKEMADCAVLTKTDLTA